MWQELNKYQQNESMNEQMGPGELGGFITNKIAITTGTINSPNNIMDRDGKDHFSWPWSCATFKNFHPFE